MSKRSYTEMASATAPGVSSPFIPMFEQFRAELDEHHDRRDRINKASRDITAASKKIIFTLQRVRTLNKPLPPPVITGNEPYRENIQTQFTSVCNDLQGLNAHRYSRQITGGNQEWMEALSFEHYLTTATLITYESAATKLSELTSPSVNLSVEDYLLGIFDMTGELMKFAITTMAMNGEMPIIDSAQGQEQRSILNDLRSLRAALENMDVSRWPSGKEVGKKMDVMKASVEKVERALYGLVVRGAERPNGGWLPDTDGGAGRAIDVEG